MAFEAGGKVAVSTIEALKSQPLALALLVINVFFLAAGIYLLHELAQAANHNRETSYKLITAMMAERNCPVKP